MSPPNDSLASRARQFFSPVEPIIRRSPLRDVLSRLYWWTELTLADDIVTARVGDYECRVHVSNIRELKRSATMMQEKEVARRMFDDISPDDVVADVGANVGIYSSFIVRQVKSGLVLCFEPEPKTQARLCQNLELNSSDDNWRIVGLALSDSAGTTTLETTGDEIGEGGHRFSEDGDFTVRTERMDELFAKGDIPQPTVVKMDVEGAEYLVLRGMERLLSNVRSLYIEVHPGEIIGGDFDDIQHLLERNGFEIQNLGKRSEIFHIVATNTRVSQ